MKNKKNLIALYLIIFGGSVYAQGNSSDIKITADVVSGCKMSGDNANFSTIEENIRTSMDLRIQCSKGISVTLTAKSSVNPQNTYGQFMGLNKKVLATPSIYSAEALHYFINTTNVVSNTDFTVVRRPRDESLFVNLRTDYDYRLLLNIKTSNEIVLPLKAQITIYNDFMKLVPGNYVDDATYGLEF